jgi:hypothetical protein
MKKKKKKKKQRDSLTVRRASLSFSLVDSNFFIFVCGLLRVMVESTKLASSLQQWCHAILLRTSDGCGKVEAWGSAKVQRRSSESIQYQCVWTIFVYDKSKSLYIYMYGSLSFASFSLFRSSHLTFFLFNFPRGAHSQLFRRERSPFLFISTRIPVRFLSSPFSLSLSLSSQFSYSIYCFR